ncbi:MAG: M15 family metallopeptidase [Clostridia bacterium]|nr:M15 family metallopeptidase [Clostridia bacterium]
MNNRQPQTNGSAYNRTSSGQPVNRTGAAQRTPQRPQSSVPQKAPYAQPRPQQSPQKKKVRIQPNKEGIIALVTLLLIVAIAITLIAVIVKAIVSAVSDRPDETSDSSSSDMGEVVPAGKWNDGFQTVSIPNTDVAVGDLILVNFENEYALTDTLGSKQLSSLYTSKGYGTYYVLKDANVSVHTKIKTALQDMIFALVDANPDTLGNVSGEDRVFITSGYRTLEKQTELYNKRTEENYVAVPGHSEHHTGYAVDIQVFTSNQKTVLLRDNEQEWMEAHCAEFGFIIRYDGSKFELTGILDEPWHYRYVGVPHATYMMESGLCMEEYLKLLRDSHNGTKDEPLTITANDTEYLVYYLPASEGTTTDLIVPPETVGSYTVSGDNMNGFIVTIEKTK